MTLNRNLSVFIIIITVAILAVSGHLFYLSSLNGDETFPEDTYLNNVTTKTALIIVAHDDDAISSSGTISELTKQGWKIHFLTFYGNWRKEDNPTRKREVEQVAKIQNLASIDLFDFSIQKTDTVEKPWMPVPYVRFADYMKTDSLEILILKAIEKYQPSVIFSLDDIFGGYGHPEHVCVSQIITRVCSENKMKESFPVNRIYQAIYTQTMNENIIGDMPVYLAAKKVYNPDQMPVPDVEIDIYNSANEKMRVMQAYESQHRNLKKYWPYYHWYPSWVYFKIFDKEYFRVINVKA